MARTKRNRKSAKRPYGWGSFRRLSSGTYELYYSLDGKRVTEYVATAAEAERRLEEVRRAKEEGRAAELAGYPFRALCDRFLRAKGSEALSRSRSGATATSSAITSCRCSAMPW